VVLHRLRQGLLQRRRLGRRPDRARFGCESHRAARYRRARRRQRRAFGRLLERARPRDQVSHRRRPRARAARLSLSDRVHAQGSDRQRQVQEPQRLKGMRMGFAAQGVTSLSLLNEAAKHAGIKFEDITPLYLPFPRRMAALQNKALDGTLLIEPQATVAVNAGYGVRFMDTKEFYPYQQISMIFFSDKFATQRKDVAEKFMRAWLRGVR